MLRKIRYFSFTLLALIVATVVGGLTRSRETFSRAFYGTLLRLYGLPMVAGGTTSFGTEEIHPVYGIKPADAGGAVATLDSVNTKNYRRMTVYLMFGAITGNADLTVKSGATAGTQTTAEGFRHRLASGVQAAATLADTYGALSARVTTLSLVAATYQNKLLVVEVDLDRETDGQPWMTVEMSNVTALNLAALIVLGHPRYSQNVMPASTE